jgi:Ca-activated chloride channel family protein
MKTMTKITHTLALAIIFCFASIFQSTNVLADSKDDKTLSPYFMVKSADPDADQLPLKTTKADVKIAGVIADVTVTQIYKNEGNNTLEAIYVFPASTKAAVYGMKMIIGDRTVTAEIREKQKARAEYEAARAEGKRASLLEQDRPNVFQMNVANIKSGDQIKVILQYTELLVPEEGIYSFVYPTVVGPRYSNQKASEAPESDKFVNTPYLKAGKAPTYNFDINVKLAAGMPIQNVGSATHKVNTKHNDLTTATIKLDATEKKGGNRDYVLNYQLAGNQVNSGLLLYEGEKENYFLMTVQPPKRVTPKQMPPKEYIFIVDVSGSMMGFALETTKKLIRDLITGLEPNDKFNMLLFAGSTGILSNESLLANQANMTKALNMIDQQRGGGGTQLLPALKEALALPRAEGLSRSVVIVTDGYVSVEKEAFDLIKNNLNKANMFAFGIGSGVNRYIIEGMAHVGKGEPMIIMEEKDAYAMADKFRKYIKSPVLTQVDVRFAGFDAYDIDPVTVPDVLAERPVVIFGKYRGTPKGKISVKGYAGKKRYRSEFDVSTVTASIDNSALKYLWAREKIKMLDDYNSLRHDENLVKKITQLGLDYNLLTAYTSFIAVDDEVVRGPNGKLVTTKQALPLPRNVANTAVGFDLSIKGVVRRSAKSTKKVAKLSVGTVKSTLSPMYNAAIAGIIAINVKSTLEQCGQLSKTKVSTNYNVTIEVDENGEITVVKITGQNIDNATRQCMTTAIEQLSFEDLNLQQAVTFQFPITITK